ncbi:DNA-binding protein [Bacteroides caecigallinarum]|nr:DNA-binding protein [Bacteroides caecigallinarum]
MSIFLKAVQRINPSEPDEPKKWYPVQYTTKRVDESEVAMLIADETTLNPMEAAMAIRQLRKVVQRLLLDGKSVKLGDWGTFNITLNTEGAERKEDLTARNVKRVNINFQPADEMKAAMQKADFVWLDKIVEGGTASGGDDEEGLPSVQDDETETPSEV